MKKALFILFFPITLPIWILKKVFGFIFRPLTKRKDKKKSASTPQITITEIDRTPQDQDEKQSLSEADDSVQKKTHPAICDGLTADQVLLLSYAKDYEIDNPSFQQFWRYSYSLSGTELRNSLAKLMDLGYVAEPTIMEILTSYTVKELKAVLEEYGLTSSGKKEALARTLVENVDEQELRSIFRRRHYMITPSGESIVEKYPYIKYAHSHDAAGYDIWSIAEAVHSRPFANWRDIIWQKFIENQHSAAQQANVYALRANYLRMGVFLLEEEKQESALSVYCEVARLDIKAAEEWRKKEEIIDDNNAISIDIKDTVNTILISMNVPAELQKGQIMSVIKQRTKYFSIEEIADMILK